MAPPISPLGPTLVIGWVLVLTAPAPPILPHAETAVQPGADPLVSGPVSLAVGVAPAFVPANFSVSPGQAVVLRIVQSSSVAHTFTLSSVANYTLSPLWTSLDLYAYFNAHPPVVNRSIPAAPGVVVWANFTSPITPGAYEYVSVVPGQFQAGMHGILAVGTIVPPGPVAPPGPSSDAWAGVLVVVIAGAVIATVILWGRRRRARRRR